MSSRAAGKESARARAAQTRAAQARAERRRRVLLAGGAVTLVVVVIAGLVIARVAGVGGSDGSGTDTASSPGLSATVGKQVTSVPATTLDAVGAGDVKAAPKKVDTPALSVDGKPQVLYVGADYCPFCAAERWPVVVALSRFGSWSSLGATSSASNDVFPDTQTLSFHGAGFTSDYLSFTGVETRTNTIKDGQYAPLDTMSPADQKVFDTYNRPPYTAGSAGGIPFIDIAGKYVSTGASFSPEVLKGRSREEIAAALADPKSVIGRAVNGSANVITAAICDATGQKPTNVCGSSAVKAGAARLPAAR